MNKSIYEGNRKLYKESFNKLKNKHVLVIGAGGVGSWACEFLLRSGVEDITIVDMDDICFTNINRQVHALSSTVGKFKVDVLKSRLLDINPEAKVKTICDFFTIDTKDKILEEKYDFVIDAFDSSLNKALLVDECSRRNIPMIVSGAAGGKADIDKVDLKNFKRVSNDMLIRNIRRDLKRHYPDFFKRDYFLPCVFSTENASIAEEDKGKGINCRGALGSSGMITSLFALKISHYILDHFIND